MTTNNFPKWHSIVIKIPSEMITKTKSGRVSLRKTLTNLGSLSTSNKMKSIKLVSSNVDTPEIIENGVMTTIDNERGPKIIKVKKQKVKMDMDAYNKMNKQYEELIATKISDLPKRMKTSKDHKAIIDRILKEYIGKKITVKTNLEKSNKNTS